MSSLPEIEELMQSLVEMGARLEKVEAICSSTKALDHRGISMVAAEGLAGGGTIDKSRAFKFDYEHMTPGKLRLGDELFAFFSPEEGEHQTLSYSSLVDAIVRLSGLPEQIEALRQSLTLLSKKVELFSFFDRLASTEQELTLLKEKFDAKEQAEAQAKTEAKT